MRPINVFTLLIITLGFACQTPANEAIDLPFYNQADFSPEWIETNDPDYKKIHTVAPFNLVNQDGDTVTNETLKGKIYVANFFFTICPTICPKMTNNLSRIQKEFVDDPEVMLVSHTVMPWIDTVEVLKEFAQLKQIESAKWHLLTGTKEQLYTLGRQSYFADEGFGKEVTLESDFLHTENIVLVDKQQRIRGVYNGTLPLEMSRLIEDIKRLKSEDQST
ncbi:MAG: SCO family protein [Marinoscillum sp.]